MLRSTPDDATIREGLRRAYRPYVVFVLALFFFVVPPLTALRIWIDDAWVVRTLLSLLVLGAGMWATGRGLRTLVRAGLDERIGKEVVLEIAGDRVRHAGVSVRLADVAVLVTGRAVVLRARGLGSVVLARGDVPAAVLERLRARR